MRKDEAMIKKQSNKGAYLLLLVSCILIPTLSNILRYFAARLSGNIMYKVEAAILPYAAELTLTLSLIVGAALMLVSIYTGSPNVILTLSLNAVAIIILYFAPFLIEWRLSAAFEYLMPYYAKITAVDIITGLLQTAALFVALKVYSLRTRAASHGLENKKTLHTATVIAIAVLMGVRLVSCIANTVSDFIYAHTEFGSAMPQNAQEWTYIVTPYILTLIWIFAGYFLMRYIVKITQK